MFHPLTAYTRERLLEHQPVWSVAERFRQLMDDAREFHPDPTHRPSMWADHTKLLGIPDKRQLAGESNHGPASKWNAADYAASFEKREPQLFGVIEDLARDFLRTKQVIDGELGYGNTNQASLDPAREAYSMDGIIPEGGTFSQYEIDEIAPYAKEHDGSRNRWRIQSKITQPHITALRQVLMDAVSRWKINKNMVEQKKHHLDPKVVEIMRVIHVDENSVYLQPQAIIHQIINNTASARNTMSVNVVGDGLPHDCANGNEAWVAPFSLICMNKTQIQTNLRSFDFGDFVVVLRTVGTKIKSFKFNMVEKWIPQYDLVSGPNATFDFVKTTTSIIPKHYSLDLVHVPRATLEKSPTSGDYNKQIDEQIPLVLASILASSSLNITPSDEESSDPDTLVFVPTWKDNRKPLEVNVGVVSGGNYKHDLIRCSMCNGAVIIKAPLDNRADTAVCPHCKSPQGLRFDHLIDGNEIQRIFPRRENN